MYSIVRLVVLWWWCGGAMTTVTPTSTPATALQRATVGCYAIRYSTVVYCSVFTAIVTAITLATLETKLVNKTSITTTS